MKRSYLFTLVLVLLFVGSANAQYPLLDMIAQKVIQKYQQSTCEQLWQQKSEPKPPMEQEIIQKLRSDPQMSAEFINRVAAPVANKMFQCVHERRWTTAGVFTTGTQSWQRKISKFEFRNSTFSNSASSGSPR
jgi:hypothetical protein